jgi:hypothetical protein
MTGIPSWSEGVETIGRELATDESYHQEVTAMVKLIQSTPEAIDRIDGVLSLAENDVPELIRPARFTIKVWDDSTLAEQQAVLLLGATVFGAVSSRLVELAVEEKRRDDGYGQYL